ncbi:class I SAM-dependent methyltransferase [Metabacillus schmidteae]|uniref:class I SAM-dependent methyltransferase n=1 Tax=Metabacillus schmidteae TaxID=2730405 RepID=UPI00158E757A|nr:class I SAM-dependent methyltransferase [Metabacillus schmidteae]
MIITTSGRPDDKLDLYAMQIADALDASYQKRNKRSVLDIKRSASDHVIVVGKNRMELHFLEEESPLFFHPNSAMFRTKRIMKGERDPFIDACNMQPGDKVLDCTLGLASDSIVASYVLGEKGLIVGIEGSSFLSYLVEKGLKQWESGLPIIDEAMRRIVVNEQDHLEFLKSCEDHSFDVVYFDPMFEESIEGSVGIEPLKKIATYSPLQIEAITEAKRVAKKRVVLKDHYKSSRFKQFHFEVNVRKSAKFHYGVIELP